ncbi:MAG: WG repeat-containing protein, partial [Muribaculaceae bacterium]|nr:WG repeat-containing protein [Muribaculaceae bacterium]
DNIYNYKEGFFSVHKGEKGNVVDTQGSELFPWKYESVSYSSNGLFSVSNNTNRVGYINLVGEEIVPCIYHFRYIDKIGNFIVAEDDNGKTLIYDIKNKKTISGANSLGVKSLLGLTPVFIEQQDDPTFYIKNQDDLYTLINEWGEKVSPYSYTDIFYSSNPMCWADNGTLMVKRDGKWGYVDEYGKELITPAFDDATPFRNGYAMVYQRGKGIEIINKRGQILSNFGPTHVIKHYEGGAYSPEWYADNKIQGLIIKKNYKYGIIDRTGKSLIPCIYDDIRPANENLLVVEKNGKKGYISSNSREVVPCIYDYCANFKNGYATVERYGKYGIINKEGEVVIPIKFDYIGDFINGIAPVKQNGRAGIVNIKGEEIWFKK